MLIQACLNGSRQSGDHSALPLSSDELAHEAKRVIDAGARALHIHPRQTDGTMTLAAHQNGEALLAIRASCPGTPVGVTTAAWIEPDIHKRLNQIRAWQVLPDYASVNFVETETPELCSLLLDKGIGIEAGLGSREDAELLVQLGIANRCLRVLIEPIDEEITAARATVTAIERVLDEANVRLPRLLHGFDATAWPLLELALERGYDTRIGLEDTLYIPSGKLAHDNAELVEFACKLAHESGR